MIHKQKVGKKLVEYFVAVKFTFQKQNGEQISECMGCQAQTTLIGTFPFPVSNEKNCLL